MDPQSPTIIEKHGSYLSFLHSKKCTLEQKKKNHLDLLEQLRLAKVTLGEDLIIDIGSGFWVKKSYYEAMKFTQSQVENASDAIRKVSAEISWYSIDSDSSKDDEIITRSKSSSIAESPLQMVEIQELLDENGDVIEAKLNDEPFLMQADIPFREGKVLENNTVETFVKDSAVKTREEKAETDDQIDELLQDMGIIHAKDEAESSHPKFMTDTDDVSSQKENQTLLEPKNVYELELIAGEFHSDDDEFEEEEDFDYDFEDSEDESFELESHSNFMASIDTSILPGNSDINERLRNEIIALRRQRQEQSMSEKESAPRRVHFNDTLEIKEIENVSAELLNIEHKKQRMLRFKEIKVLNSQPSATTKFVDASKKANDSIDNSHNQPKSRDSASSEVISDIFERNDGITSDQQEVFSRDVNRPSKFRKRKETDGSNYPVPALKTDKIDTLKHSIPKKEMSDQISVVETKPCQLDQIRTSDLEALSTVNEDEDENFKTQMEILVKAYHEGNFDEDISVTGPVVHKLDDFSMLNKMVESMSVKDTETTVTNKPGISHDSDSTNEVGNFSSDSSDEEIMTDFIVEREIDDLATADEDENIHDPDQVEHQVIDREITEQYHRLKQKLFAQRYANSEDQEYEDMGNVSRFKSRKFQSH